MIGFTNGIALLIASTQLRDFFGMRVDKVPGEFVARLRTLAAHASDFTPQAALLASATLILILLMRRFTPRIPGSIVALAGATIVSRVMGLNVETIGTRCGGIPPGLPHLSLPQFRPDLVPVLFGPALTIAMLGAIESLLSATVADRLAGVHPSVRPRDDPLRRSRTAGSPDARCRVRTSRRRRKYLSQYFRGFEARRRNLHRRAFAELNPAANLKSDEPAA